MGFLISMGLPITTNGRLEVGGSLVVELLVDGMAVVDRDS
jgi:hypothetical protein